MNVYNPDDWLDLLGLLIIGAAFVAAATVPAWVTARRQRSLHSDMTAVKDQVQNQHPTNLRDDIDAISGAVQCVRDHQGELSRDVSGIRTDIGQLRSELRTERADRIAADQAIKVEIQRET